MLKRITDGLLLREDFATLAAWSGSGWVSAADPTLVAFDPSPMFAQSPGTADVDGCREGQLYVEGSTWTLVYDGGDDVHGWTQFTATSVDRGLTWAKNGAQSIGYNDGAGSTHAAVATGWLEKRGSTYYLYRVTANDVYTAPTGQGLPKGPYFGDVWTASSLTGTWTFLRAFPTDGTGWAAGQNLPGSVYFDGTTYHLFNEGFNGTIGRYHGTSIAGAWTEDTTQITGYLADGRYVENPKVFYHSGFARYVMLANAVSPSGVGDQNTLWVSTSLTDWSTATVRRMQHASPLDSPNEVGVISHVTGPDGALVAESDGSVPVIFDGFPRGNAGSGWHLGRHLQYAVLEPAVTCARYTHADTTPRRLTRPVPHRDFVAEWAVELRTIDATNGVVSFEFRRQDDGNYYRLALTAGSGLRLDKVVAGTPTTLAGASSPSELGATNLLHRIRLVAVGTTLEARLNGEEHINLTDATYSSGASVAFTATDCDGDLRLFSLRAAHTVTINDTQVGQVITLRGAGGIPIVTTTAASSSVTLTTSHYPLVSFDVDSTSYTPPAGIWGGDVYSLNASPLPSAFG